MSDRPVIEAAGRFGQLRRRRRMCIGVALAVLATLGGGGWVLLTSSAFSLRTVLIKLTVNQTSSLTKRDVARAARVPLHRPLIEVDAAEIGERVASLPAVGAVTVHRSWPHTLVLDVVARRAAAELDTGDGEFLADPAGVVYAAAAAAHRPVRLPTVRIAGRVQVADRPQPAATATVRTVSALPAAVLRAARHLGYGAATGLVFGYRGMEVIWGGAGDGPGKAAELATAAARRGAQRPAWVDVSTPGVLVTRKLAPPGIPTAERAARGRRGTSRAQKGGRP